MKKLVRRLISEALPRKTKVVTRAMGRERAFSAYDRGADTFVLEKDIFKTINERASVLIVEKKDLRCGMRGHVMTISSGTHAVAAIPLLHGQFWDLANTRAEESSALMTSCVLCANCVDGMIEISQRDVPCEKVVALDNWLLSIGFGLSDVQMVERNDETLEYYRMLGQEWRVRPLAWTDREIRAALDSSRKKISTDISYYHSVKGVHFLTYREFNRFANKAKNDFDAFKAGLDELTGVFEDNATNFLRMPKKHGHNEIEFFGLKRGAALEQLIPGLETLAHLVSLPNVEREEIVSRMEMLDSLFKSLLTRPELADEDSVAFRESLYMYLTGEIYSIAGEGVAPAFDDRRTALPGATFEHGRPIFHPGTDSRTEVLLSNVRVMMSEGEILEYANIYELRTDDDSRESQSLGQGLTREVVFKTNRRPLTMSYVEKRLSQTALDYGSYVVSRITGFKSLGVNLADYRLMRRRDRDRSGIFHDFYLRTRCEGEPLQDIPASYYRLSEMDNISEDSRFVSELAFYMGDAAAQNVVMKKYDKSRKSCFYGVGKEIYRFSYDSNAKRLMPCNVSCCSIRGTMGWTDISKTEDNMRALAKFYMTEFAKVLFNFASMHKSVPIDTLMSRFMDGFANRTRIMEWALTFRREEFEMFDPKLPKRYGFLPKWTFALWSLDWQAANMEVFEEQLKNALAAMALSEEVL
jgi:hypothetical protein